MVSCLKVLLSNLSPSPHPNTFYHVVNVPASVSESPVVPSVRVCVTQFVMTTAFKLPEKPGGKKVFRTTSRNHFSEHLVFSHLHSSQQTLDSAEFQKASSLTGVMLIL